jgi:hypothetical protein
MPTGPHQARTVRSRGAPEPIAAVPAARRESSSSRRIYRHGSWHGLTVPRSSTTRRRLPLIMIWRRLDQLADVAFRTRSQGLGTWSTPSTQPHDPGDHRSCCRTAQASHNDLVEPPGAPCGCANGRAACPCIQNRGQGHEGPHSACGPVVDPKCVRHAAARPWRPPILLPQCTG